MKASKEEQREEKSLQDDLCSGQAHRAITPDVIARIDGLIWENRRITQKEIRVQVGISHGSVHAIIKGRSSEKFARRDEMWCHHFVSESKQQSQQWKHLNSPRPKKSKAVHMSSGKVMMTFFFDFRGPLLVEFLEHGATINAKHYAGRLQKL
ncbi:hypothetical protein J437_LFUL016675 [Ladona fulva]|uniref:Transposase n=1 Tax=Ladona fulva TaxID=123851 RepID=A0A8K0KLW8_LADFU|nr:hypothetical protein J437_LFUL016675 [Ladona fulva]